MSSNTCITSLDLCAVRVSKLAEGGAPISGASNGYVSDAAISLGISITTEAGDDLVQKNGCGAIMATLQEPDKIKGLELSAEFCQLDSILFEILTGAELFVSGADIIGFQFAAVGAEPSPICFEGWSKAWDNDRQGSMPGTSDAAYIHWVFPFTRWVQGDMTLEHDLLVAPASAKGSENANITSNGPFDDWPTAVVNRGGVTRIGGWFYDSVLPTADCDYVTVSSAAS